MANPSYEAVCTDITGHSEVVQVQYEPAAVSYARLLDVFFQVPSSGGVSSEIPREWRTMRSERAQQSYSLLRLSSHACVH